MINPSSDVSQPTQTRQAKQKSLGFLANGRFKKETLGCVIWDHPIIGIDGGGFF